MTYLFLDSLMDNYTIYSRWNIYLWYQLPFKILFIFFNPISNHIPRKNLHILEIISSKKHIYCSYFTNPRPKYKIWVFVSIWKGREIYSCIKLPFSWPTFIVFQTLKRKNIFSFKLLRYLQSTSWGRKIKTRKQISF